MTTFSSRVVFVVAFLVAILVGSFSAQAAATSDSGRFLTQGAPLGPDLAKVFLAAKHDARSSLLGNTSGKTAVAGKSKKLTSKKPKASKKATLKKSSSSSLAKYTQKPTSKKSARVKSKKAKTSKKPLQKTSRSYRSL